VRFPATGRAWSPAWALAPILVFGACSPTAVATGSPPWDATGLPVETEAQSPIASVETPATPTDGASAEPLPTATIRPPEALLAGSAVRVAVPELNLRLTPSQDARRVGLLTPDHILSLGSRPIEAGGYTWYEAVVISSNGEMPELGSSLIPDDLLLGWVAVATRSTPYVERIPPRCPGAVDVAYLGAMLPAEHLACFGGATLALEGVYGCPGICDAIYPGTFKPVWLAHPITFSELRPYPVPPDRIPGVVQVRFPPRGQAAPGRGAIISVHGHFNDDRAASCSMAMPLPNSDGDVPFAPEAAELACRQRFVAEDYTVIGVDPEFQLG
jgi:hypothetical protein